MREKVVHFNKGAQDELQSKYHYSVYGDSQLTNKSLGLY